MTQEKKTGFGSPIWEKSKYWLRHNVPNLSRMRSVAYSDILDYVKALRSIGTFVHILTGKNIPVTIATDGASYTDHKTVRIGANIENFDATVGIALHEGSHIVKTDPKYFISPMGISESDATLIYRPTAIRSDVQKTINMVAAKYNITDEQAFKYVTERLKTLANLFEDWRIDAWQYKEAPGYRGYYEALYKMVFEDPNINAALEAAEYRTLTWRSYMLHTIYSTRPNRDLDALPGLREMWKLINVQDILRFQTAHEVFDVALEVFNIYEKYVDKQQQEAEDKANKSKSGQGNEGEGGEGGESGDEEIDGDELADAIERGEVNVGGSGGVGGKSPKIKMTDKLRKAIEKKMKEQIDFINGKSKKSNVSGEVAQQVKTLMDAGVTVGSTDHTKTSSGNSGQGKGTGAGAVTGTEVIVIKQLNEGIIHSSGLGVFSGNNNSAINEGKQLGRALGQKLLLRREQRETVFNRQNMGRIDKRMLAQLGCGNESVFYTKTIDSVNPMFVHISIDASGSMDGSRLYKAIKTAVAIAVAANIVKGMHVAISFRYGVNNNPLVLVAYDSRIDHISKLNLIRYIDATGGTPESLCYPSIRDMMLPGTQKFDSYFITITDGDPGWSGYGDCISHCQTEMKYMNANNIKVLAFLVDSHSSTFKQMYAKNGSEIDSTALGELARELNKLFLGQK